MKDLKKRYPRTIDCKGHEVELQIAASLETEELQTFTASLPERDLLFLSRDIREPKVLEAWSRSLASGDIITVAATDQTINKGRIIGTTAIVTDKHSWSAHVGELRILVHPEARDIGLGRELIQESFLIGLSLGLEKLTVRMLLDQEAAINVLEEMGFRSEALFRDHVKDPSGEKHDLLIMSHDVAGVSGMMQAYGIDEAL